MRTLIAIILIQVIALGAFANEQDSIPEKGITEKVYINEARWMISDLVDGVMQLGYERKFGENISLAVNFGLKNENGLIRMSGIETPSIVTSDITYSGFKIIPEFRYYFKKTQQYQLDGFYVGAYTKYSKFGSNLYGSYFNDEGTEYRIDADLNISIVSLGLMVGYKLPISKRFNVDFLIAAPGGSNHRYSLDNNVTLPDEFYEDVVEALESYSFFDYLKSDFRWEVKKRRTEFFFPMFRYGISISYRF